MSTHFSIKYLYLPIKVLLTFNIFTVLLFVFGPVNWKSENEILVVVYILFNLLFLYLGYHFGINSYLPLKKKNSYKKVKVLLFIFLCIGFFWSIPSSYLRLGGANFDFENLASKITGNFLNSAVGYNEKAENFEAGNNSFLQMLDFFLSIFMYSFFPLSLYYFKNFSIVVKSLIVFVIIIECVSWIMIGTNKGIVDIFLIFLLVSFVSDPSLFKFSLKKALVSISSIGVVLFFFISAMFSRYGAVDDIGILENLDFNVLGNPLKSTGIYTNMGISLKFSIMQITSYLSQGYYNLSIALGEDFTWTYGFGNSWMGIFIWERLSGENLLSKTYLGILEYKHGIDAKVAWHSIYTWFASDFSFFGVPIIIFFIGYFFAKSWLDTIYDSNFFALIVFCLFGQMIFYFFANNQILSFSFIPFMFFFTFWIVNRYTVNSND